MSLENARISPEYIPRCETKVTMKRTLVCPTLIL